MRVLRSAHIRWRCARTRACPPLSRNRARLGSWWTAKLPLP